MLRPRFLLACVAIVAAAFSVTLLSNQLLGKRLWVATSTSPALSEARDSTTTALGASPPSPQESAATAATTSTETVSLSTPPSHSVPSPPPSASSPTQPSASPVSKPSTESAEAEKAALLSASGELRAALVNILCLAPASARIHSISGSGVMVGSAGYVLTDAHVAQYFLLADKGVACTIRTGDPAQDAYRAELAYIPAKWINANSTVLTETAPTGTGENDFALLAITRSATSAPLPATFPAVPIAYAAPAINTPVVIGSYAAQFLNFNQVISSLSPTIAYGSIKDLLTFGTTTADVASLGGSAAAQEGSSGGGVVNASGALVGDITTSSVTGSTAERSLSAITASYLRREYEAQTGASLDVLLATPPSGAAQAFAPQASKLEAILISANGLN